MPPTAAFFSDGRSAARIAAFVRIDDHILIVANAEGRTLTAWPVATLRRVAGPGGQTGELILSASTAPDARLTIADPAFARALPALARPSADLGWKAMAGWTGLTVAMALAFYVALPWLAAGAAALVPASWEDALGRQVHAQIATVLGGKAAGACRSQAGHQALSTLTDRLARAGGIEGAVTVDVLDSRHANAFALPGQRLVLLRGLLDAAEHPDELAGVLAHELGHLARRHPMRRLMRQQGLAIVVGALTGQGMIGNVGSLLAGLSYSRDDERSADADAIATLAAAGIRADRFGPFVEKISRAAGETPLPFLSDHPAGEERATLGAGRSHERAPALPPADWAAVKALCDPGRAT